jgi:hypothetical protein
MRKFLSAGSLLLLVIALALALVACGSDDGAATEPASPEPAADVDPQQLVEESWAKMADVNSMAFTADVGLKISGDPSAMSDPTAAALLQDGITFRAEGASSTHPVAADMTMNIGIMGESLDMGMLAQGDKAWIQYDGVWYEADAKTSSSLSDEAASGATPTEQLKDMGLDPAAWDPEYTLVGTETVDGTEVYHVTATADPVKLADALKKAAEDPSLGEKLGDPATAQQLEQSLAQSDEQLESLRKSLRDVQVDYWIGVDDQLMRKLQATADMDTKGQKDMEGLDAMAFDVSITMSGFDEPVTVDPPKNAKSSDELMNQLLGGFMTMGGGAGF